MFEQLLKGITQSSQNNRKGSDGWDQPPIRVNRVSQEKGQSDTPGFLSKIGSLGVQVEEYDSEEDQPAIDINASVQQSIKNSQVLSINEIGNNGDEGHPMIISQIDNRVEINNQSVKKIKISAFYLRQLCIELTEYLDEQRLQQQELKYKMMQQLADITRKMISTSQRRPIETACNKCQQLKKQMNVLAAEKDRIEQNLQSVTFQKDRLQEQAFDMQQKMYGIDLQVQKRLKQKEKNRGIIQIPPIPEQTKEIIEHLQQQNSNLNDKLKKYESMLQNKQSKDQLRDLKEREKDLQKRQITLQQQLNHLQLVKQASYQREHEILLAEENLSKKIAEMRKKQAQLSQWEAEVARRKKEDRTVHRDNTLAQQFPSNDPSFNQSAEDLNNSRQMSLKSFGKNPHLQQKQGFSPQSEQMEHLQTFYKTRTQTDEQIRNRRQPNIIQHQNYPLLQGRKYKPSESNYIPKARRDNNQPGIAKRYNPQISNYSREASPYRVLNQPVRGRQGAQMYQLPRNSPGHFRQVSKNSRSTSKSKVGALVQGQLAARNQKDNQLGGLGSKLQRLREEIKRQIDSIK